MSERLLFRLPDRDLTDLGLSARQPNPRGVKKTSTRTVPSRDGPKAASSTDWELRLGIGQKPRPPKAGRVCAYHLCGNHLDGMKPTADYCSRNHKQAAKRHRRQQTRAAAGRTAICSECGDVVAVIARHGALPKYCGKHHPKQPCAGCGRTLRHHAVSQFCRACQTARRSVPPARIWTCLCDVCGALFEAPAGTNFCTIHTTTKED